LLIARINGRKRKSVSKKLLLMLFMLKLSLPQQQIHQMMVPYCASRLLASNDVSSKRYSKDISRCCFLIIVLWQVRASKRMTFLLKASKVHSMRSLYSGDIIIFTPLLPEQGIIAKTV